MQDLDELLALLAGARKIYGKEPVAPYHGSNRVSGSKRVRATPPRSHPDSNLCGPGDRRPGQARRGRLRAGDHGS